MAALEGLDVILVDIYGVRHDNGKGVRALLLSY